MSRMLLTNTLACANAVVWGWSIAWVVKYWALIQSLPSEVLRCLDVASR